MTNKHHKEDKTDELKDSTKEASACEQEEQIVLSKSDYQALKAKADEQDAYKDKYLRSHAEFDNIKKRMDKEKADFIKYANEGLIFEFLPIIDNLEMAEKYIKEAKDFNSVRAGVDMIQAQIQKFLKEIGVEKIKTVGDKFDPHLHDPMETEESKDKEDGIIVAELKPGYRLNGKLLRPAAVRVVKKKTE